MADLRVTDPATGERVASLLKAAARRLEPPPGS
jgi:hypothetical protein